MSQLFNFSFQTLAGAPDSPGAINKNQVVYAYTQNAKTLLVLTNGDSRIAGSALADVKSTFGLTSIGTPTRANGQVISLGEVLVNNDYVTQVFDDTASRRVEMNQPASAPVVFTTPVTLTGVVANSFAGEKGYKEWIGYVNATPASSYWKMGFPGVVTSGNISTSIIVEIAAGAQSGQNSGTIPRVNLGTAEEISSIVISTWSASLTTFAVANKFLVSIKFFG